MSPLSSIHPSAWRDCLESPDGHQTEATEANIEGQGDRIFALQANDLASLTPLQPTFQTVSLRRWMNSSGQDSSSIHSGLLLCLVGKSTRGAPSWRHERRTSDETERVMGSVRGTARRRRGSTGRRDRICQ